MDKDQERSRIILTAASMCLALNIYMEARGEPEISQIGVAATTINRLRHKDYPKSVCKVVYSKQAFSWTNKKAKINERKSFDRAKRIAELYTSGKLQNPIGKRLYFNHKSLGKRFNTKYKPIVLGELMYY